MRDLIGYGEHPPVVGWPGGARVAVSLVLNFEEGAESSIEAGDARDEDISIFGGWSADPTRRSLMKESFFEYGSRVGIWRYLGLFREFGFVLAIAVLLSCVVALTLCPMLASRMLTTASLHHEGGTGVGTRIGGALNEAYRRSLRFCLGAPWIVVMVALLFAATAFALFGTIRQELTPTEDRSAVLLRINAPQGVSLEYTASQMEKIERLISAMISC